MKNDTLKVGAKILTWFSGRDDGLSTVLEIKPYTGKYPQWFDCVLVLTAPNTKARQIEMAYDSTDYKYETRATTSVTTITDVRASE